MKKLVLGMMFGLLVIGAQAQFTTAELKATGLTCAMCNNAINKAIKALPFIETVKSDIKNSSFQMVFKQGQEVNIDAIKKAVEDAGFSVGHLELSGNFDNVPVSDDKHLAIGSSMFHFVNTGDRVLTPDTKLTVIDKNYLGMKQFKKISAASGMECVQTGKAGTCCKDAGVSPGSRVYHVSII